VQGPLTERRWYCEPLVHFAVLGLALFALFRVVGPTPQTGETILVSSETLARIEAEQTRRLGRAPEPAELDAAVRSWADAEMLYREARALGLDRGDPIVRRRLMQKMQFLFEEAEPLPEPSDVELEKWIADHADRFEQAPRFAVTHVYVQASSRTMPEATLREIEVALAEGADPATLGQAFALGQELAAKTVAELNRSFGPGFGDAVAELPDVGWHRVRSIYGWHLVHLDERLPGRLAGVDEVRAQAREGLLREAREQAAARALDELRQRYAVEIEGRDE
jgi:peptidyl-prolyl cis-trans isomerase C